MSGAANNPYLESRDDLLRIMTAPTLGRTTRYTGESVLVKARLMPSMKRLQLVHSMICTLVTIGLSAVSTTVLGRLITSSTVVTRLVLTTTWLSYLTLACTMRP